MGGIRVDAESQMSTLPGLFASGECAVGINGANRLGGNSLSDLLVFGKRAGEFAARYAKENAHGSIDSKIIQAAEREALEPFDRRDGESPYDIQRDLQETMQELVGIVRTESEMLNALEKINILKLRAKQVTVDGNREYNPGWHAALDLKNLLTVSEAVTRSALERKESRGAQFRDDFPEKDLRFGKINMVVLQGPEGKMQIRQETIPEMPAELKKIIEENQV